MIKSESFSDRVGLLKYCCVCGEEAEKGKVQKRHYGGIVCLSCRAFFRRVLSETKKPLFHCKQNGNCLIDVYNRRSCRKCRYSKCIEAGLQPDAVLDDYQKVVRFRRWNAKQKCKNKYTKHYSSKTIERQIQDCETKVKNNGNGGCSSRIMELQMSYTAEEDCWLEKQFQLVESAFRSVEAGEALLLESIRFSRGMPLPMDYGKRICALHMQRILETYLALQEFNQMSTSFQLELLERNSPLGLGLLVAKAENYGTGLNQLQDGFGELDQQRWDQEYSRLFGSGTSIKKISLTDMIPKKSESKILKLIQTLRSVSFMSEQPWMFKMSLLIGLMSPKNLSSNEILNETHHKYLYLFERKLSWINYINRRERDVEAQIRKLLFGVELISSISDLLVETFL